MLPDSENIPHYCASLTRVISLRSISITPLRDLGADSDVAYAGTLADGRFC